MFQAGRISRDAATKHLAKNNWQAAIVSASTAVQCYLSVAVNRFATSAEGRTFLQQEAVSPLLAQLCDADTRIARGESVYGLLLNAHAAWLLGEDALAERFVEIANNTEAVPGSSSFWSEYASAAKALVKRTAYVAPEKPALRDLENYWWHYLTLIQAVTTRAGINSAYQAVVESFVSRNMDLALRDDGKRIDGTGRGPVKWDFRLASIADYCRRAYSVEF